MSRWIVSVVLVGCSAGGSAGGSAVAPVVVAPASTRVAAAPPPPPWAALDLGFEQVDGDRPRGWSSTTGYAWAAVDDVHHGGAHSLRVQGTGGYGAVLAQLPAASLRGQIVQLHGWVKTEHTGGLAGLVLRAGDASDTMPWTRRNGTSDWTEVKTEIQVPDGADTLQIGALLVGDGTAWFDDLQLEVAGLSPPIVLAGTVVDAAGKPVAGAEVALQSGFNVPAHVVAGGDGRFRFEVAAGRWGFSASHPGQVATFVDTKPFAADTKDIALTLGDRDGVVVHGKVTPAPRDGYILVGISSAHDADTFTVPVAPDGTYSVTLPRGDRYTAQLLSPVSGRGAATRHGDDVTIDIALSGPAGGAVSPELTPWIAANAVPLATAEPEHGIADLAPLGRWIGAARMVALGEATHGSREMFQLKHRVLEYLVATQGFTVFALEADQAECHAINDYVMRGVGNPEVVLDGLYKWPWDTEEVLALIAWMRRWNADPAHRRKVEFAGFDMLTSRVAYAELAAFLARVAPADAPGLLAPIAVLGQHTASAAIAKLPQAEVDAIVPGLAAVTRAFDRNARAWARTPDFGQVRHDVTLLGQATQRYLAARAGIGDGKIRGRAMADNLLWLLDHEPAGTRVVVWAHNSHVAHRVDDPANLDMGGYLRQRLQTGYYSLGFLFSQGAFQIWTDRPRIGLNEVTIGPPAEGDASWAFARTGLPLLALDLRAIPARGPVHDWFAAPHPIRMAGTNFSSEAELYRSVVLPAWFDGMIYVDRTTRARPMVFP